MEYKIAIPSFKRASTLRKKTLAYLEKCSVPQNKIYVFVADKQEHQCYAKELANTEYNIIIGEHTLCAQRNFINQYFADGEYILNFDDDVDGLFVADFVGKKILPFIEIDALALVGYNLMQANKTKIYGVYPVANHFFMDENVTIDNRYIVGCFWGCIIDHDEQLKITLEDKEDFERTIKYFKKFGSVVRINSYCVKTNYYKEPGGMQETRTKQRVHDSAVFLVQNYPDYCKLNTAKKNKEFTEIKLITPSGAPQPVNLFGF